MTIVLDKNRGKWRYDFVHKGARYRGYCVDKDGLPVKNKTAARQAETRERDRIERGDVERGGRNICSSLTLADVAASAREAWDCGEAQMGNNAVYVREILSYFGPDKLICKVDDEACLGYRTFCANQPLMVWTGGARKADSPDTEKLWKPTDKKRSRSTVNRYLAALRVLLKHAYMMRDSVTRERAIREIPAFKNFEENEWESQPIPHDVIGFLRELLPQHATEAMDVALHFGLRLEEILSLRLQDVNFQDRGIRLAADTVKNKKGSLQKGSADAMELLRTLCDQAKARGVGHLITYRQSKRTDSKEPWRRIYDIDSAWDSAMESVQKKFGRKYRFHDTRARYITNVGIALGSAVAQKMARHADPSTTMRYMNVGDKEAERAADAASEALKRQAA